MQAEYKASSDSVQKHMQTQREHTRRGCVPWWVARPTFAYVPACVLDGGVAVDVG